MSTATILLAQSSSQPGSITGLYRYAVKGLSGDSLEKVHIANARETFPDDRRFALQWVTADDDDESSSPSFDPIQPQWIHKSEFLCAFTKPTFLAQFQSRYQIQQDDTMAPLEEEMEVVSHGLPLDDRLVEGISIEAPVLTRNLQIYDRASQELLWGPMDLATLEGRESLSEFFSRQAEATGGRNVQCVTANSEGRGNSEQHKHQFGNTSSGVKKHKDTRTIHIVNAATVRQVAEKANVGSLNPTRFRPNMVVDGWEPWEEFQWIDKHITLHCKGNDDPYAPKTVRLKIISKTVRCDGVSVDPDDPEQVLDIPKLLVEHFPKHGPYLGVYATIESPGTISLGDDLYFESTED